MIAFFHGQGNEKSVCAAGYSETSVCLQNSPVSFTYCELPEEFLKSVCQGFVEFVDNPQHGNYRILTMPSATCGNLEKTSGSCPGIINEISG